MRKIIQYKVTFRISLLLFLALFQWNYQLQAQCPVTPNFEITEQFCDSIVLTNLSTPVALIDSVVWDFGDGETLTEIMAPFDTIHVYTSPGNYDIIMTTWDNTLCDDSKTLQVIVEMPVANFWADTVCFGEITKMFDISTTNVFPIDKWFWEYDGTTSILTNPTHNFSTTGEVDVKIKVTNTIGCIDSTNHLIRIGDFPTADFTIQLGCPDDTSFFFDNSTINAESIINWSWDIGSGLNPSMSPDTFGIYPTGPYDITLEIENNHGCTNNLTQSIIVEGPTAGFWADTVCFGLETSFYDTSLFNNYPIEDWLWTMDFGTVYTDQNPTHLYSFQGIDIVKLAVTNSIGCIDSTEHEIRIDSLPEANFSFGAGCVGLETCFMDKSIANSDSISSWFWEFGDGGISMMQKPCHIYIVADTFQVQLTVTNSNGCMSVKTDTLIVKGVPFAAFSADQTCFDDTTFFLNETDTVGLQIDFWEWDFGDLASGINNTSSLMHPNHLFTQEGEFSVKLKTGAYDGCVDSIVSIVVVDTLPEAVFTMPDTVAMGSIVVFNDISIPHGANIYIRNWDFGDGTGASNPNPVTHTFFEPGNFEVCLAIIDIKGCVDTLCKTITVSVLPLADFWYQSDTTLVTDFFDNSFPDTINIVDWFWQFGDISAFGADTSHLENPQYQYPQIGWYYVNLEILDNYGGNHDTTKAIYAGKAVVSNFLHEDVCFGDTILFIDESNSPINANFEEWQWDFGDGSDSTYIEETDSLYHYYELPGVYTVTLITSATVNDGILTDTLHRDVYVFNPPVAYFDTTDLLVCKGTPIVFSDSSYTIDADTVASWSWDFGDNNYSDLQEYPHIYSDTGNYIVSLTVATSHQCVDSVKAQSMVAIAPDISFRIENACVNSPAQFIPDETSMKITNWWWDFGDKYNGGDTSSLANPTHVYSRVDVYWVTMTASSYGCDKVEQKAYIIKPIPYSDFNVAPNYQNVQGKTSFTNNSIYATHYLWDFGNGESSTVPDPIEIYEKDSTYQITLISLNEDLCADTSRYELLVFFRGLYFPTAFSPNNPNDGISKFSPKGVNLREYLVQVFDMGGNLLWESELLDEDGSPVESWDGYYNGLLMPQGMYIWKAQGTFKDGSIWKGSELQSENPQPFGTVTLVR